MADEKKNIDPVTGKRRYHKKLSTYEGCRREITRCIAAVKQQKMTTEECRAIVGAIRVLMDAIEKGVMEDKIKVLEATVLKLRAERDAAREREGQEEQ